MAASAPNATRIPVLVIGGPPKALESVDSESLPDIFRSDDYPPSGPGFNGCIPKARAFFVAVVASFS
jgi:hypothetical protein